MGFVESFLTERPQDGLDAVQSRLRKGRALHEQVANYFKERAHIEDMYAKSITKAFQKHFVTDTQTLGSFTAPWEKLSAEAMELATLHTQLSSRITSEVERPLRDFARTHPEWQNLTLAEANCNRIAKEFDDRHSKVTKYTKAVEKVSGKKAEAAEQKLTEYTRNLDSIRSAWRLEGPVILQKYQSVDQSRLEHLKQIASTFEAIQTEIMLQIVEISGNTSASIGEFDPLMDIELFTSEASINMQSLEPPHDGASVASGTSYPGNGDTIGSMDPRRSNGTHKRGLTGSSQLSNISFSDRSVTQSKAASIDHRTADTQDQIRSASTSLFGSTIEIPPNNVDAEGYTVPPPDHGPWSDAGFSSNNDDERSETSSFFSQAPRMHMEIKQESVTESTDEARAALERVTSTLKQTKTMSRRHPDRRNVRSMYQSEDLTGHNSYQSSPLSTPFPTDSSSGSRVLLNNSSSHLQVSTPFSPGNSRGNNLVVPPLPAHSQSQLNQPIPPMPSLTIANANGPESPSTTAPTLSAPQRLTTDPDLLANTGTSAPTSPISAPPAGTGAGHKRTWVTSVVEKVHVHTQGGQVSKMMVTGEVIMTIEGTEADPEQPTEALLRLDQLQVLEKCVPHQTYLSSEEEGAYWVDLVALSQAIQQNGAGQGIVVLKYQVKVTEEEARQTMIPLLVHPAWKCEPHQTSLLINYKVNPHCKISQPVPSVTGVPEGGDIAAQEAQLSELSFLVPISGAVVNAQSRPTGIWNSETSRMFWDVDNLTMSSTAPESQKLLARFELNSTGGPSQASPTAAKFRVQGRLLSDVKVHLERANRQEEQTRVAFGSVRLQVQSGRYLAAA
ncbi:Muniscin C-terminal mu homology domain-containing protein [Mortierella sp. GBAus27b]|nr:Muniscin C-terminal mu homology domain-containing protein [Mortierella sp. GBAus27b]